MKTAKPYLPGAPADNPQAEFFGDSSRGVRGTKNRRTVPTNIRTSEDSRSTCFKLFHHITEPLFVQTASGGIVNSNKTEDQPAVF